MCWSRVSGIAADGLLLAPRTSQAIKSYKGDSRESQSSREIPNESPQKAESPYSPWANRMRLLELDQEAIPQPLPTNQSSNGVYRTYTANSQVVGHINRDLSKSFMLGCRGSECRGDSFGTPRIELKPHVFEFYRLREVDRRRLRYA